MQNEMRPAAASSASVKFLSFWWSVESSSSISSTSSLVSCSFSQPSCSSSVAGTSSSRVRNSSMSRGCKYSRYYYMYFVASELKDPIWHSLEWQIGSFSFKRDDLIKWRSCQYYVPVTATYFIGIFTDFKLCLADAINNFKWVGTPTKYSADTGTIRTLYINLSSLKIICIMNMSCVAVIIN